MKKLIYSLITISFIFTSCSKEQGCMDSIATNYNVDAEEDDNSCTYGLTGGAWIANSATEDGTISVTMAGIPFFDSTWTYTESNPDSIEPYKLKFNDDATWNEYDLNNIIIGGGTWSQSGNDLTITDSDTSMVLNIVSVSKEQSTLELTFSDSENDGGMIMSYNVTSTLNFNRDVNSCCEENTAQRIGKNQWFDKKKFRKLLK